MRGRLISQRAMGKNSLLELQFIDSEHEVSSSTVSHAGQGYLVGKGKVRGYSCNGMRDGHLRQ